MRFNVNEAETVSLLGTKGEGGRWRTDENGQSREEKSCAERLIERLVG